MENPSHSMRPQDPMRREGFDARVSGIASLTEPLRRALYRYVVSQPSPVSRDQAADGVGVAHHAAKFHLDKLVDEGLLEAEFTRPPGRGGPGAGRPAKRYRRSARELEVSVPERRYDLAGWLLARAVTDAERDGVPVGEALARAARDIGESFGIQARSRAGRRPSRNALSAAARDVLEQLGYEPQTRSSGIKLANCPFHVLADDYTELVCGMNLNLLQGMVTGLGPPGLEACPDPGPGRCCVRLRTPPRPRAGQAGEVR
jgi:predicted ArsR family transcriptional regulator